MKVNGQKVQVSVTHKVAYCPMCPVSCQRTMEEGSTIWDGLRAHLKMIHPGTVLEED